jgi:hypothetical protein
MRIRQPSAGGTSLAEEPVEVELDSAPKDPELPVLRPGSRLDAPGTLLPLLLASVSSLWEREGSWAVAERSPGA